MGKHKSEGAETGSGATAASVDFPDPFPPLPQQPYRADDSEGPESNTDPLIPAAEFHDADPATDPALPVLDPYDQFDQFDPFAADAYRPGLPWYRKSSAVVALAAIALALIAILVAAVLLVSGRWGGSGKSDTDTVTPIPSTSGTSQAPTTTPLTSAPPPPPPPPPPPSEPPPAPHQTYYPQYPRQNENGPAPRPQTRPPDISVRPTHRTAFPNQPGAN